MSMVTVLDHGYIALEDSMGDDLSIVNAARVSYDKRSEEMTDADVGLIGYLARNDHGTPFEHNAMRFRVRAPIFVFREWHRHRIGISINEQSARYMELERLFYVPAAENVRTRVGKPGNYRYDWIGPEKADVACDMIWETCNCAFNTYEKMLLFGVAPEVARVVLPVNTYSTMIWTCNFRSAMNFIRLRSAPTAQYEIRCYSQAMEKMVESIFPVAYASFKEQA